MNKTDARISALKFVESHVNEMVNWLCKSIEFRSISGLNVAGNELEIQEWIRNEFEKRGVFDKLDYWLVDPERRRPNLVGISKAKAIWEGTSSTMAMLMWFLCRSRSVSAGTLTHGKDLSRMVVFVEEARVT